MATVTNQAFDTTAHTQRLTVMCDSESFEHLAVGVANANRVKLSGPNDPSYHTRFLNTHLLDIVFDAAPSWMTFACRSLQGAEKSMSLSSIGTTTLLLVPEVRASTAVAQRLTGP